MKIILAGYQKKTVNSSGGIFTVLAISGAVELSAKGMEDIPLELSDQIRLDDAKQLSLQNVGDTEAVIEFIIASNSVDKKSQAMRISNDILKVELDRDVNIGAVNQDGAWVVGVDVMPDMVVKNATINTHKPRVECLAGVSTKLFDAAIRKSKRINIRADQLNGVSLGGSNLVDDNSGGFLAVGMVDYIDTSGALWAFNNGAQSVYVDVLELI
jgi:hypothetical protein